MIAAHLRGQGIRPDLVLCSPARRATETLDGIATALDAARVEVEEQLYGAHAEDLLARLRRLPEAVASVMLIGHNPAMQELALLLAAPCDARESLARKYPTAALATLDFEGSAWGDLGPGRADLTAYVRPRELS